MVLFICRAIWKIKSHFTERRTVAKSVFIPVQNKVGINISKISQVLVLPTWQEYFMVPGAGIQALGNRYPQGFPATHDQAEGKPPVTSTKAHQSALPTVPGKLLGQPKSWQHWDRAVKETQSSEAAATTIPSFSLRSIVPGYEILRWRSPPD